MAQEHADLGSVLIATNGAGGKVMEAEFPGSCLEHWRGAGPPGGARSGDAIRSSVHDRDVDPGVEHAESHRQRNRAQVEVLLLSLGARHGNVEL